MIKHKTIPYEINFLNIIANEFVNSKTWNELSIFLFDDNTTFQKLFIKMLKNYDLNLESNNLVYDISSLVNNHTTIVYLNKKDKTFIFNKEEYELKKNQGLQNALNSVGLKIIN